MAHCADGDMGATNPSAKTWCKWEGIARRKAGRGQHRGVLAQTDYETSLDSWSQ